MREGISIKFLLLSPILILFHGMIITLLVTQPEAVEEEVVVVVVVAVEIFEFKVEGQNPSRVLHLFSWSL